MYFLHQLELVLERRKKSVPFDYPFDQRQVEVRTQRQRLRINLRPAANEHLAPGQGRVRPIDLAQIRRRPRSGMRKTAAAQNDGGAIGQRFADGLEGLCVPSPPPGRWSFF